MGMEAESDTGPLPEEVTADELWRTSPDALLVVERGGAIRAANMAARLLFGYKPGSLVTMNVDDLTPTEARKAHRQEREGFEANPNPRSMSDRQRLQGMKADGTCFPVLDALVEPPHIGAGAERRLRAREQQHSCRWVIFKEVQAFHHLVGHLRA